MSTVQGKKASAKQVETITKNAERLFSGSASVVIEMMSDYDLLNKVSKACFENNAENKQAAARALYALIEKKSAKDAEWRKSHPQASAEDVPSA